MRSLLLARHGESEYSAKQLVNGDPGVSCPLTETGRQQARALAQPLAAEQVDLCAVTDFERVRETAELALAGRDVVLMPHLDEAGRRSATTIADALRGIAARVRVVDLRVALRRSWQ